MSVMINLLPDIRLQKQRDKQRRQMVTAIAFLVMLVSGGLLILMIVITSGQSILIKNANDSISKKKNTLTNMQGLIPAMSTQARLNSISTLYAQRTLMTKLMTVLGEVSPTAMQITSLKYSQADSSLAITGNVQSNAEATKLTRALEATHLSIGTGSPSDEPYFTNVVLESVSRSDTNGATKLVNFSISATVAPGAIHAE